MSEPAAAPHRRLPVLVCLLLLVGGCADLPWLSTTAPVVDAEPMSVSPPASDAVVEPTAGPTDGAADGAVGAGSGTGD